MNNNHKNILFFIVLLFSLLLNAADNYYSWYKNSVGKKVVVYSDVNPYILKTLFDTFTKEKGINVEYLISNGDFSNNSLQLIAQSSDVFFIRDALKLYNVTKKKILTSENNEYLNSTIANHLIDYENHWFGLGFFAKLIVYNTNNVVNGELTNYQDLASNKWANRLCLTDLKSPANRAFLAAMVADIGFDKTKITILKMVKNMTGKPYKDDTAIINAITSNACDVAIIDSDSYINIKNTKSHYNFKALTPNQNKKGAYINISGAGIVKNSDNYLQAKTLIEWLASAKAQIMYSNLSNQYPVNLNINSLNLLQLKYNKLNITKFGTLDDKVSLLVQEINY